MSKLREDLKLYPSNIWFIALTVLIPALYGLFNRYFIGYMNMDAILVEQSYEALEVLQEVFLEMIPLVVVAVTSQNYTDKKEIIKIVKNSVIFQLIITVSFTLIFLFGAKNFINFINMPENTRTMAITYFRLKSLILPIQSVWMIFAIGIKSVNPRKAVLLSISNVVVNYLLDCIMISNFAFSLRLNLVGSALSAIISNLITLIIAFLLFKKEVGITKEFFTFKMDRISLSKIIKIGKYTGLESLVRNLGYIIGVIAVINLIDSDMSIAAYNTVNNIYWSIVLVPTLALTEGTKFAIGNAVGNKDKNMIKRVMKLTTYILTAWMILALILGQILVPSISSWLNNTIYSQDVANLTVETFNILWIAYFAFVISSIGNSFFYGLGNPKPILLVSTVINIIIYIPLGLLCKYGIIHLSYNLVLIVTVLIYWLNTLITYVLYRKGINSFN